MTRISLVMVLYGKRAVTEDGLASLERALEDKLGDEIELVLVDNASPDDTGVLLDAWEQRATVLRLERNLNFSGGCNAGARAAAGEILVFLNNDMEFVPGAIEALAATAAQDGVGAAGARLVFGDGTLQHGGVVFVAGEQHPAMPQHTFHHEAGDLAAARAVVDLDAVTAACLAIRRELFLDLDGFDESYRNGLEDVDLCLRIRTRGLRIVYRGDICLVHHESQTRGVDNAASAHNDAVFQARWAALCAADDELAAEVYGGALTRYGTGLPLVPHEYLAGTQVSVEGHLRSIAPEAAEARALLLALALAGLAPAARDRIPAWLVATLSETEAAVLQAAQGRLRSPTALRIEAPAGRLYSARRRHGDVLRLAAAPDDLDHLHGVTAVWAATPELAMELVELGLDAGRVAYLPAPIVPPPAGAGGSGLLAVLPGHDLVSCRDALEALAAVPAVRLLPNVLGSELRGLVAEHAPHAELLTPTTSEERYASYAGAADAVLCLDPSDAFGRRALIAAATGAAVLSDNPVAAAVLGAELAPDLPALLQRTGGRRARRETVIAACSPQVLATRLTELVARARAAGPSTARRRTPVLTPAS